MKDVAAHVAPTVGGGSGAFFVALVRSGFDPDRASFRVVRGASAILAAVWPTYVSMPANARSPPGLGPGSQLADVLVHTLDIAVPLGITVDRPVEHWHHVLTWLTSAQARRGFVSEGMPAVTLVTASVRYGDGPEVSGPPAALALALCGRDALLTQLSGPGLEVFARWVGRVRKE